MPRSISGGNGFPGATAGALLALGASITPGTSSRKHGQRSRAGRRLTGHRVGLGVPHDAGADGDPEDDQQHRRGRERGRVPPRRSARPGRRRREAERTAAPGPPVKLGENRGGLALVPRAEFGEVTIRARVRPRARTRARGWRRARRACPRGGASWRRSGGSGRRLRLSRSRPRSGHSTNATAGTPITTATTITPAPITSRPRPLGESARSSPRRPRPAAGGHRDADGSSAISERPRRPAPRRRPRTRLYRVR